MPVSITVHVIVLLYKNATSQLRLRYKDSISFVFLSDETYDVAVLSPSNSGSITLHTYVFTGPDHKWHVNIRYKDSVQAVPLEEGAMDHEIDVVFTPSDPNGVPRASARKNRKRATLCEEVIAKDLRGKRHKGSGSLSYLKGDVRVKGKFRIESKFTRMKSYSVKLSDLDKIRSECASGEMPMFDITWVDPHTDKALEEWVLVPRDLFKEK